MPIHQNFFLKVNVFPEFVNKSENNALVKLSEDASFFYWVFIRLGICTPKKCSENDIRRHPLSTYALIKGRGLGESVQKIMQF
jgi:hypothetical protein